MRLHELTRLVEKCQRVGRGIAAGGGKTAGRGTKGQKARTGKGAPVGFEGGQTRLFRRLPKRADFPTRTDKRVTVTLGAVERAFTDGARIDTRTLIRAGLITPGQRAKLVARGPLTRANLRVGGDVAVSAAARAQLTSRTPTAA